MQNKSLNVSGYSKVVKRMQNANEKKKIDQKRKEEIGRP